jgi:hypothetical protein
VIVSWTAPDNGGDAIIGYQVRVRQNNGVTFSVPSVNCDMSANTATSCSIPVSELKSTPFLLDWGTSVFAKVSAINSYGLSEESDEANGALITTSPDPPANFAEVYEQRTKSTIGLSWEEPAFIGGSEIQDYRVNIAI